MRISEIYQNSCAFCNNIYYDLDIYTYNLHIQLNSVVLAVLSLMLYLVYVILELQKLK